MFENGKQISSFSNLCTVLQGLQLSKCALYGSKEEGNIKVTISAELINDNQFIEFFQLSGLAIVLDCCMKTVFDKVIKVSIFVTIYFH